jgi:hypothetical protein
MSFTERAERVTANHYALPRLGTMLRPYLIGLSWTAWLIATTADAQPAPEPVEVAESPEEITVTGQRSLSALDRDIGVATEKFWELLNGALADPQFEVTCGRVVETGTRISDRECLTRFARDELRIAGQAVVRGYAYDPQARIALKSRELADKMVEIINARPELRAAVEELARLKKQYAAELEHRSAE